MKAANVNRKQLDVADGETAGLDGVRARIYACPSFIEENVAASELPRRRRTLKRAWMALIGLIVILAFVGCGGGAETTSADADATSADVDAGATEAMQTSSGEEEEEDLLKQWGPEEMPDQYAQPLEFLHWRVDRMFEVEDADTDGRISLDEYSGESFNFDRIDMNSDGYITKKEVIDDRIPIMREEGKIP